MRHNARQTDNNKSFIDQASSVEVAGYWPRSLFAFLRFNGPRLCLGP